MLAHILAMLAKAAAEGGAAMAQKAGGNLGKMASGDVLEDTGLKNAKSITDALRGGRSHAAASASKEADALDKAVKSILDSSGRAAVAAAATGSQKPYGATAKFAAGDWRAANPVRDPFQYGTAPGPAQPQSQTAFMSGHWHGPPPPAPPAPPGSPSPVKPPRSNSKTNRGLWDTAVAAAENYPGTVAIGAAAMLAKGLVEGVKAIDGFNKSLIESQRDLGKWNGSIAKSTARYDVAQIQMAQMTAQQTSRSYDALTRAQIAMERNIQPIESAWQNIKNYMGAGLARSVEAFTAPGYFGVSDAAKAVLGDDGGTLNQADQFLKSMFDEATNQTAIKNAKSPIIGPRPRKP